MSDLPRRRSPAPPAPPTKDSSAATSAAYLGRPSSRYVNNTLAEAVRDSVHIGSGRASAKANGARYSPPPQLPRDYSIDLSDDLAPPLPVSGVGTYLTSSSGSRQGVERAHHQHSSSSPDIDFSAPTMAQPRLPSQYMADQNRNPFDEDLDGKSRASTAAREGPGGATLPPRSKYQRSNTAPSIPTPILAIEEGLIIASNVPESPTKTRVRRSMSTDSYAVDAAAVIAGQRKAADDKKASRHADVIDTWDPTGLGSAMWHHSGPYDAAAPSRNLNQPNTKAPMHAFNEPGKAAAPVSASARGPSTIQLSPPEPPAKEGKNTETAQPRRAARQSNRRPEGGGLTGQYSTSMPSAGGYFPDPGEPMDEAALARRERQKQREEKRRALKAAWGIDTPEPFEDFGMSPGEESFDMPAESPPDVDKPMRSPGLFTSFGARNSPVKEDPNAINEDAPIGRPMSAYRTTSNQGGTGVKRTKSLMQKIKTMVRQRAGSLESSDPLPVIRPSYGAGQRSQSVNHGLGSMGGSLNSRPMISPNAPPGALLEEEELVDELGGLPRTAPPGGHGGFGQFDDAQGDVFGPGEMGQWNVGPEHTRRDSPNMPLRGSPNRPNTHHDQLPTIPSFADGLTAEDIARANKSKTPSPGVSPSKVKRPFFASKRSSMSGRASPQPQNASSPSPTDQPEGVGAAELEVTSASVGSFQLVDVLPPKPRVRSTSSPLVATGGLVEQQQQPLQHQFTDADEGEEVLSAPLPAPAASGRRSARRMNETDPAFPTGFSRSKGLPAPPVGQVMPDFEDLSVRRVSPGLGGRDGEGERPAENLRRKPSMVKKLREKLVK